MTEVQALAFLGCTDLSSETEIRTAYRAVCRRLHPDTGSADAAGWARLQDAWKVLTATKEKRGQCATCRGSRSVERVGPNWRKLVVICPACHGSGRKPET
jgi:DnaJ-class molecular chaperone